MRKREWPSSLALSSPFALLLFVFLPYSVGSSAIVPLSLFFEVVYSSRLYIITLSLASNLCHCEHVTPTLRLLFHCPCPTPRMKGLCAELGVRPLTFLTLFVCFFFHTTTPLFSPPLSQLFHSCLCILLFLAYAFKSPSFFVPAHLNFELDLYTFILVHATNPSFTQLIAPSPSTIAPTKSLLRRYWIPSRPSACKTSRQGDLASSAPTCDHGLFLANADLCGRSTCSRG